MEKEIIALKHLGGGGLPEAEHHSGANFKGSLSTTIYT